MRGRIESCWNRFPSYAAEPAGHLLSCFKVIRTGCQDLRSRTCYLSASSRMTILCRPAGKVTFFWAKVLILFRTTSIPLNNRVSRSETEARSRFAHLSSDAFSSNTPSLYASPNSWCARQWMLVVFPIPGIPFRQLSIDSGKK